MTSYSRSTPQHDYLRQRTVIVLEYLRWASVLASKMTPYMPPWMNGRPPATSPAPPPRVNGYRRAPSKAGAGKVGHAPAARPATGHVAVFSPAPGHRAGETDMRRRGFASAGTTRTSRQGRGGSRNGPPRPRRRRRRVCVQGAGLDFPAACTPRYGRHRLAALDEGRHLVQRPDPFGL